MTVQVERVLHTIRLVTEDQVIVFQTAARALGNPQPEVLGRVGDFDNAIGTRNVAKLTGAREMH
jgi:hypothetical protein